MRTNVVASSLAGLGLVFGLAAGHTAGADDTLDFVAKRGTSVLTEQEIDARLAEIAPDQRAGFLTDPARIEQLLSQLLLLEQLADEARAVGLDKDPRLAPQMALAEKRALSQLRLDQLRTEAMEKIDAPTLARERYLADPSKFAEPERRTARHILIDAVKDSEESDTAAKAEIDAIAARLAEGESFETLAKELSDDTGSAAAGGLIADIAPGTTDPAFDAALFALARSGARSQPVRSVYGYHLIELVEIKPSRQRPFEEVQAELEKVVRDSTVDRVVRSHTDQLLSLPTEANPDAIDKLRTSTSAQAGQDAPSAASPPARQP